MEGQYPLFYQQFHQIIFIKDFQVRLLSYKQVNTVSRPIRSAETEPLLAVGCLDWKLTSLVYSEVCFHDSKAELRIYF